MTETPNRVGSTIRQAHTVVHAIEVLRAVEPECQRR